MVGESTKRLDAPGNASFPLPFRALTDHPAPFVGLTGRFFLSGCLTLDSDFHSILAATRAVKPSVVRLRTEGLKGESLAIILQHVLTLWPDPNWTLAPSFPSPRTGYGFVASQLVHEGPPR